MQNQIALSLETLIAYKVKPLLKRSHLNRDIIIGFIGDRGDGKSMGAGEVALLDWGVEPGEIIRSNMDINANITVSDEYAERYGLSGGSVHYESEPLDKLKFLRFDPEYYRNIFVIDEINIFLADARRAMSNQNLEADDVGQQLRKLQSPLIYTCISEMFVDTRIRDLTDVFIKTEDTALSPLGLARKQQQGIEFQWYLYPITRKLTGERYADTKQRLGPYFIRGNRFWDLIDTNLRQERKKLKDLEAEVKVTQDDRTQRFNEQYGWIGETLIALSKSGVNSLSNLEIKKYFPDVDKAILKEHFGFVWDNFAQEWDFGHYNAPLPPEPVLV